MVSDISDTAIKLDSFIGTMSIKALPKFMTILSILLCALRHIIVSRYIVKPNATARVKRVEAGNANQGIYGVCC